MIQLTAEDSREVIKGSSEIEAIAEAIGIGGCDCLKSNFLGLKIASKIASAIASKKSCQPCVFEGCLRQ